MCDMLSTVEFGQLGPISVLAYFAPAGPLGPSSPADSLHVPHSLVPSSHHSLPHCPTPLFPLSSYKPHFLLCQIRIVHRQLWRCPRSSPNPLVSPDYIVSLSHLLFHDPYWTCLYCINTRCPLPRVHHVYVFVNYLQGQVCCTFPHSDVFPYTFRLKRFDFDRP